jgi:hypothetical protein
MNGSSYGIDELELVFLKALRERATTKDKLHGRVETSVVTGDVRRMPRSRENVGALFQVAAQFNLLQTAVSPDVTPEEGVTRYPRDPTQGPACGVGSREDQRTADGARIDPRGFESFEEQTNSLIRMGGLQE